LTYLFVLALKRNWIGRRWLDFRQGHSLYLVFMMTFANFITIQYALLINRIPWLESIFSNLWIFALLFVTGYIPLAIVVGNWHRTSQWKIEQEATFRENVVGARMWLFMLELIDGNVTDEEKQEMRQFLRQILKKQRVDKTSEPISVNKEAAGLRDEKPVHIKE
jgi:hypothetical protein